MPGALVTRVGRPKVFTFTSNDSRNSRAARWLRNKWFKSVCRVCPVPEWKLDKYSAPILSVTAGHRLSMTLNARRPETDPLG